MDESKEILGFTSLNDAVFVLLFPFFFPTDLCGTVLEYRTVPAKAFEVFSCKEMGEGIVLPFQNSSTYGDVGIRV